MYVSITNDKGLTKKITKEISSGWNDIWIAENTTFEEELQSHKDRSCLSRYMFFCLGRQSLTSSMDELQ